MLNDKEISKVQESYNKYIANLERVQTQVKEVCKFSDMNGFSKTTFTYNINASLIPQGIGLDYVDPLSAYLEIVYDGYDVKLRIVVTTKSYKEYKTTFEHVGGVKELQEHLLLRIVGIGDSAYIERR